MLCANANVDAMLLILQHLILHEAKTLKSRVNSRGRSSGLIHIFFFLFMYPVLHSKITPEKVL